MNKKIYLSIVIPCLNEKYTIRQVINDAKKNAEKYFPSCHEIIVADNGSTDGSIKIVEKLNINLIRVPVRGYGAALHWGITNAAGKYVLFADADMSYPFSNLARFRKALTSSPDLVLGSRIKGVIGKDAMPWVHRYLGTPVLTFLVKKIYKINTSDCNSGMRVVKKSFYQKLNMRNSGMEWASELLLKTALRKGKYNEVPIRFVKDKRGRKPHLSTWPDGWRHLKAIFLLKPSTLYPIAIALPTIGIIMFFMRFSFAFVFLLLDLSVVFFLSLLTLHLLQSAIENKTSDVSRLLNSFSLIPFTAILLVVVTIAILVVPPENLGTKLFLVSIFGIVFMWIFLVETIKTHLVNRLPDVNKT